MRVVGPAGEQLGVLTIEAALEQANQLGMDLVEVNPMAKPPVCKIMDYGKFKYEEKKKASEAKKKQVVVHLKEVKLRPKTEEHDYEFKVRNVKRFLEEGNKARITIMFRGREITHKELGQALLDDVVKDLKDVGGGRADAPHGRAADVHDPRAQPEGARSGRAIWPGSRRPAPRRRRQPSRPRQPAAARKPAASGRREAAGCPGRLRRRRRPPRLSTKRLPASAVGPGLADGVADGAVEGRTHMPKMKTRSGAKKRFQVKKSGKVKHGKAFAKHLFTHAKTAEQQAPQPRHRSPARHGREEGHQGAVPLRGELAVRRRRGRSGVRSHARQEGFQGSSSS